MEVVIKEKQVKEVDVVTESYTLCDKCNEKIKIIDYDAFEFDFVHKTGRAYPEGGSGGKQQMDLCQKCAVELVAFLRVNGYRISSSEWDF